MACLCDESDGAAVLDESKSLLDAVVIRFGRGADSSVGSGPGSAASHAGFESELVDIGKGKATGMGRSPTDRGKEPSNNEISAK